MRREVLAAIVFAVAANAASQTTTLTAGTVGDSSTLGPVVDYRITTDTGDVRAFSISGWRIAYTTEQRTTPNGRRVMSIAITPYAANNSDHIYVDGERRSDLEFRDTSFEASVGRIDLVSERWSSDIRLVALYEHPTAVDERTKDFWRAPYAGIRSRQTWSRITAEDPFLLTFRGSEVAAQVELFGGRDLWSRVELDQRWGRRLGLIDVGERVEMMAGSGLDDVSAFLIGGSWPIAGVHTLYGARYGEFRVERAATATGDASFVVHDSLAIGAHVSVMRSSDLTARGAAVDLSRSFGGIGVRIGIGIPVASSADRSAVAYLSLFAARFVSPR